MAPNHAPNDELLKAYSVWADGGYGMILTGNVQTGEEFLGSPNDVAFQSATPSQQWKDYASTIQAHGSAGIVQVNHPGRQSPAGTGTKGLMAKNVAPSAVPMNLGPSWAEWAVSRATFGTPRALTTMEVYGIIDDFVKTCKLVKDAGFKGVQLHAAHGYLFAQFMSPATNLRTDEFGGDALKRVAVVVKTIKAVREACGPDFCIGIKLNSVDAAEAGELDNTLQQVGAIVEAGIDFVEVSGGSYENPRMMGDAANNYNSHTSDSSAGVAPVKASTAKREAFFLSFATAVRERFPKVVLMVTGGFRTRLGMEDALASGAADIIGIGRPVCVVPKLPKEIILNENVRDEDAHVKLENVEAPLLMRLGPKALGAGWQSIYYAGQIARMGRGLEPIDTRVKA
jgi:2,4-dienoyl-CoA reductase-like NADH-dependent reductase (Old Yellow Enzyme family)